MKSEFNQVKTKIDRIDREVNREVKKVQAMVEAVIKQQQTEQMKIENAQLSMNEKFTDLQQRMSYFDIKTSDTLYSLKEKLESIEEIQEHVDDLTAFKELFTVPQVIGSDTKEFRY